MNADLLLKEFHRISEAPDAVVRLKLLVLELAMRGKLVAQVQEDEPASALLKKLGSMKTAGKDSQLSPSTLPFKLPPSWEWTPATGPAILVSDQGKKLQVKDILKEGRYPVVDQGKVFIRGYCDDAEKVIRVESAVIVFGDHTRETKLIDFDFVVGADGVKILKPLLINPRYYFLALQWLPLNSRGYARHFKLLRAAAIPVAPLAEQDRIVAKVAELMSLCNELELAQTKRETRRRNLVTASLHRLSNAANNADPSSFEENARFYFRHLPRFTTRPEHIQQLRQAIVNLAVRGKLTIQNKTDQPAALLLVQIRDEKNRLVRAGLIGSVDSDDTSFDELYPLPESWVWTTWETVAMKIGDVDHKMPETAEGGIPYVSPQNFLPKNRIDYQNAKTISSEDFIRLSKKIRPEQGDLIYPRYGTIGENRLVTVNHDFLASYSCAVIKVLKGFIDPMYQYIFSISDVAQTQAKAAENKTTQANVGIKSIKRFLFPLPPLGEQKRIATKVDQLMSLCEDLEAQLNRSNMNRQQLFEATLQEALASAEARSEIAVGA
jgi:type I restriction enzyme, S subunit